MSTVETKYVIYPLDELGMALYRKLKVDSDHLLWLGAQIKCKRRVIAAFTEMWLYFEGEELDDDADSVYNQKLRLEHELASLERQELEQKEKVKSRCHPLIAC